MRKVVCCPRAVPRSGTAYTTTEDRGSECCGGPWERGRGEVRGNEEHKQNRQSRIRDWRSEFAFHVAVSRGLKSPRSSGGTDLV